MDVGINVPEGNEVLAIVSIQQQQDGYFQGQLERSSFGVSSKISSHQLANVLRWLADAVELDSIQSSADFE